MGIAGLLNRVGSAYERFQREGKGFLNRIWGGSKEGNPLKDLEIQVEIYGKLVDFDQNLRSLEVEYLEHLKKVG